MKLFSRSPVVLAAEQRLEHSKQQLREQIDHIRSALTGPSSLLAITGIGALLGSWLASRKAATTAAGAGFPVRSLLFALLARYILKRLAKRSSSAAV